MWPKANEYYGILILSSAENQDCCVSVQFSHSVVSWLFATPRTAACQASLSISNSQSLLKLMPTVSMIPSNHLILGRPLLLLPSMFPSIRVFSNESAFHIRWPKYWSFSFNTSPPMTRQVWFPLGGLVGSPCSPRDSQESSPTPQFKASILWCSAFFTV